MVSYNRITGSREAALRQGLKPKGRDDDGCSMRQHESPAPPKGVAQLTLGGRTHT